MKTTLILSLTLLILNAFAQRNFELLDRGLVAVKVSDGVFLSWRVFGTDTDDVSFNLYRNGTLVNSSPITGASNYTDASGTTGASYTVKAVKNGAELSYDDGIAQVWDSQVLTINLNSPGSNYTPNDCSVGDLDGDGQYEIVVKWYPDNAKDNSQSGVTDKTYLEAYKFDGTSLWRIDLGINIRSGAHYTQFLVYDFDSDGYAEVACKTAPGTKDGNGNHLNSGPAANDINDANYVNSSGFIITGEEYITVFDGITGAELATANYEVDRYPTNGWGKSSDNVNRVDRFNSTIAYLDGKKPSMIFARGYYGRLTMTAWDWNGTTLAKRWLFDSNNTGNGAAAGQGNHSIMAADGDGDGFDELYTGSAAIDHDGRLQWTTGHGHGDANHIGDLNLDNPGLEIWQVSEETGSQPDHYMIDAKTGTILWGQGSGNDNGRGMCGDIDARYPGQEVWSNSVAGTYDSKGNKISDNRGSRNFRAYWDGDLQDEFLDGNKIDKWTGNGTTRLITLQGNSCNTTKATPNLSGDIIGDWREEVILHDGVSKLYLTTTTIPTTHRMYTLMHDPTYRNAITWQQSAYNQPPHLGFFLGNGADNAPMPNIIMIGGMDCNGVEGGRAYLDECGECVGGNTGNTACYIDCNGDRDGTALIDGCGDCSGGNTGIAACPGALQGEEYCDAVGVVESSNTGYKGDGYVNFDNATGTTGTWNIYAESAITTTLRVRYANGGGSARSMTVAVNGSNQGTFTGANTGSWTTWVTEDISVNLTKGVNTILLTSTGSDGGPNIDIIYFTDHGLSVGSCTSDCNGEFGGIAYTDNCGDCVEGSTGLEPCFFDCNGDKNGAATLDDCGICSGGNTSVTPCLGVIQGEDFCSANGTADSDNAGFIGDGFVNLENATGATASWFITSETAQTAAIEIRYANGSTAARGMSIEINGTAQAFLTGSVTGSWTSWSSETVNVNLSQGINSIALVASDDGGGPNIDALLFLSNGLSTGGCDADCNGDVGGSAYFDNCNSCVGGNTGNEACEQDCNGDWGGTAYLDNCNNCVDGNTGEAACVVQIIALKAGWNIIGYPFSEEKPIEEALSAIWNDVLIVKNFDAFYDSSVSSEFNLLSKLKFGQGYFIKVEKNCELQW